MMIPGPELTLGEKKFTVPPLDWAALKKHKSLLARAMQGQVDASTAMDDFEQIFDAVYLALKRNYPELTEAELEKLIDMRNVSEAFAKVMESVGFKEKPAGE